MAKTDQVIVGPSFYCVSLFSTSY